MPFAAMNASLHFSFLLSKVFLIVWANSALLNISDTLAGIVGSSKTVVVCQNPVGQMSEYL